MYVLKVVEVEVKLNIYISIDFDLESDAALVVQRGVVQLQQLAVRAPDAEQHVQADLEAARVAAQRHVAVLVSGIRIDALLVKNIFSLRVVCGKGSTNTRIRYT